jgi:hypothetical protein
MARRETSRAECPPVAGGTKPDLRTGEKMLPTAQTGSRQAHHASWNRGRSQSRPTGDGILRAAEHGFHRAGESDHPSWSGRAGSSHLGDGAAVPTLVSSSGVVARLLSLCASPPHTARGARAATRARWQPAGATLPTTYTCHGNRQNHPTMDGARGALVSLAAGFCLRGMEVRGGCSVISRGDW